MKVLAITVKTDEAAQSLQDFLQTIDYVETVNQVSDNATEDIPSLTKGHYAPSEKPSDYSGIWKNRKKIDSKKLRQRAWKRKK